MADEDRCKSCRSFLPGNSVQLRHGARRRHPADPEQSPLFEQWAADLGGVEELTTAERAVLRRAVEADTVCRTAYDFLARTRKTISNAHVQKALAVLASHTGNVYRAAQVLGLQRRTKRAGSIRDWAAQWHEQQASEAASAPETAEPEADDELHDTLDLAASPDPGAGRRDRAPERPEDARGARRGYHGTPRFEGAARSTGAVPLPGLTGIPEPELVADEAAP